MPIRSGLRSRAPRARPCWLVLLVAFAIGACAHAPDPVVADPAIFDAQHPPRVIETAFDSAGARMNAVIYEAQGPGPHPTVLLLHGFPGFEKNLDVGQALRRAGWNVVFFHYRGTWGSEGRFSFANVLADVASVVETVRDGAFAERHRIDPQSVALVGHSMGGFAALVSGSELDAVRCVVSLAGANLGGFARAAATDPDAGAGMARSLDGWSGPVVGPGGAVLVAEVAANAERFDTLNHASRLARKPVLMIAGGLDDVTPVTSHHDPLADAIRDHAGARLRTAVIEDGDHSFSGQRIALTRHVVEWLEGECLTAARALR